MSRRWPRRRMRTVALRLGLPVLLLAVVSSVLSELVTGWLTARAWQVAVGVSVLSLGLLLLLSYLGVSEENGVAAPEQVEPLPRHDPLPPRIRLIGRARLLAVARERARDLGVVLVVGPSGAGTSALALELARILAPDPAQQDYVDLRGAAPGRPESRRRVVIRVLTALGLAPGRVRNEEDAARRIAAQLADSGRVVLLDNVRQADQISWLPRGLAGAYLVVAGDVEVPPDWAGYVLPVGPLEVADAVELLCRPPAAGNAPAMVAARVADDPEAARELARRYLTWPKIAVEVGTWLAANPAVTVPALLADLGREPHGRIVDRVSELLLGGVSEPARRLLGALAGAPLAELPEAAVTVLTDWSAGAVTDLLDELGQRLLVERLQAARYRVATAARALAPARSRLERDRAAVRLVEFYATGAMAAAAVLRPGSQPEELRAAARWLTDEGFALLELLRMPEPPVRAGPALWRIAEALESWFSWENRPYDRQEAAAAAALTASRIGDQGAYRTAQLRLASLARLFGRLDEADQHLRLAQEGLSEQDGGGTDSRVATGRALLHSAAGDLAAAETSVRDSQRVRSRRDRTGQVTDLVNLGAVLLDSGRTEEAYGPLTEAMTLAEEIGDPAGVAHSRELLGILAWRWQNPQRAIGHWTAAERTYRQLHDDLGQARCLLHEGSSLLAADPPTEADRVRARALLHRSLALRGDHGTGVGPALAHAYLAADHAARGEPADASGHCQEALDALPAPGDGRQHSPAVLAVRRYVASVERKD